MRVFSHVNGGLTLLIRYIYLPRCVMINTERVYRAVMTVLAPMRIMVILD